MNALVQNVIQTDPKYYPIETSWKDIESVHRYVPFSAVEIKLQQIEEKYKISFITFLKYVCTTAEFKKNASNITYIEIKKVLKMTAKVIATGISIGWVIRKATAVRYVNFVTELQAVVAILGVSILAGAGIGVTKFIKQMSNEFKTWKEGLEKEQYDLLLNCLKNYSPDKSYNNITNLLCPLTLEIPTIPVVSPNGHVFEKKAINRHLDEKWEYIKYLTTSNYSASKIDEQLNTVCPFRGKPFKEEDLKYATSFAKDAISSLKSIKDSLKINPNADPILLEFLCKILTHYINFYKKVNNEIISLLIRDIINVGGTDEQRRQIIDNFTEAVQPSVD